MKTYRKSMINFVCLCALPFLTGCIPLVIGAAAGAGGITYAKGAMRMNLDHPIEDVHEATLKALKGLDIFVVDDDLSKHKAAVNAEFEDGEKIKIFIDALTEHTSKITIRIGMLGHEEKSQIILNAIQLHL